MFRFNISCSQYPHWIHKLPEGHRRQANLLNRHQDGLCTAERPSPTLPSPTSDRPPTGTFRWGISGVHSDHRDNSQAFYSARLQLTNSSGQPCTRAPRAIVHQRMHVEGSPSSCRCAGGCRTLPPSTSWRSPPSCSPANRLPPIRSPC